MLEDANLLNGLNVYHGLITCKGVAEALEMNYVKPQQALADDDLKHMA